MTEIKSNTKSLFCTTKFSSSQNSLNIDVQLMKCESGLKDASGARATVYRCEPRYNLSNYPAATQRVHSLLAVDTATDSQLAFLVSGA